jgi:hypothetical protein
MSDDVEPSSAPILASDAERERSIALLREAVGEGRLTLEEFTERVELAQAARTDQDLARLGRVRPATHAAAGPPVADGPRLTINTRGPGGTLHVRTRPPTREPEGVGQAPPARDQGSTRICLPDPR